MPGQTGLSSSPRMIELHQPVPGMDALFRLRMSPSFDQQGKAIQGQTDMMEKACLSSGIPLFQEVEQSLEGAVDLTLVKPRNR